MPTPFRFLTRFLPLPLLLVLLACIIYALLRVCSQHLDRALAEILLSELRELLTETTGRGKAEIYGFCLEFLPVYTAGRKRALLRTARL